MNNTEKDKKYKQPTPTPTPPTPPTANRGCRVGFISAIEVAACCFLTVGGSYPLLSKVSERPRPAP